MTQQAYVDFFDQAQGGGGITPFVGYQNHRGRGLWSSLLNKAIIPFAKFIGKRALSGGADLAEDLLDGHNFKTAAKRRALEQTKDIGKVMAGRARTLASKIQSGSGRRRRRVYKRKAKPRKRVIRKRVSRRKRRVVKKIPDFLR